MEEDVHGVSNSDDDWKMDDDAVEDERRDDTNSQRVEEVVSGCHWAEAWIVDVTSNPMVGVLLVVDCDWAVLKTDAVNWEEQMNVAVGSWDGVPIDLVEVDLNDHVVEDADCCNNGHLMDEDVAAAAADFVMNEGHNILRFSTSFWE